jgi:hypothetical protein
MKPNDDIVIESETLGVVKGKLLAAQMVFDEWTTQYKLSDEEFKKAIRRQLANALADAMLSGEFVTFTSVKLPDTMQTKVLARLFILPDDQYHAVILPVLKRIKEQR